MSSTSAVPTERIKSFKNKGKDNEELRRRRNEVNVELRKRTRDHSLSKRRNVCLDNSFDNNDDTKNNEITDKPTKEIAPLSLQEIKDGIFSNQPSKQYPAIQGARKLLSREEEPQVDTLLDFGIIPRCVEFSKQSKNPNLQFEAVWVLTNIASGTTEHTKKVVNAGALPQLIALLSSPYEHVCEQAVWALGNIIGDGAAMRDLAIHHGLIEPLLGFVLFKEQTKSFMRNVAWVISNVCKHKNPPPSIQVVKEILPALYQLLNNSDEEVLVDVSWSISYLTDRANENLQLVINSGVVPRLLELLQSGNLKLVRPSLRSLGNLVRGTDLQTDVVVNAGVLPTLSQLLSCSNMNVVKEAAWTISNIVAGTTEQVQKVIDAKILHPLVNVLRSGHFKAQKEAAWAITNLTSTGLNSQVGSLYDAGALQPMCDLLKINDANVVRVLLDGITNILTVASEENKLENVIEAIEEFGGLDKIEDLQKHENEQVYKMAAEIIDIFFTDSDNEEAGNDETKKEQGTTESLEAKFQLDGDTEMAIAF